MRDWGTSNLSSDFDNRTKFVVPVVALSYDGSENTGLRVFSSESFYDPGTKNLPVIPGASTNDANNASRETALLLDLRFPTESMRHIPRVRGVEDVERSLSFTLPNKPVLDGLFGSLEEELKVWFSSEYSNGAIGGGLLGSTRVRLMLLSLDPKYLESQDLPYIQMEPSGAEATLFSDLYGAEVEAGDEFLSIGASNEPTPEEWPIIPAGSHPPDVGERLPIIFGYAEKTRCVVSRATASSPLAFPLGYDGRTLQLVNASNFSDPVIDSSGSIQAVEITVGGETMSYQGKNGNTLTGLLRTAGVGAGPSTHLAGTVCSSIPMGSGAVVVISAGQVELRNLYVLSNERELLRVSKLDYRVSQEWNETVPLAGYVTTATFTKSGYKRTVDASVASEVINVTTLHDESEGAVSTGTWRPGFGNPADGDWTKTTGVNPYEVYSADGDWSFSTGTNRLTFSTEGNVENSYGTIRQAFVENETILGTDLQGGQDGSSGSWLGWGQSWPVDWQGVSKNDLSFHQPMKVKFVFNIVVTQCEGPDGNPVEAEVGFFSQGMQVARGALSGNAILCTSSFNKPGTYRVESRSYDIFSSTSVPLTLTGEVWNNFQDIFPNPASPSGPIPQVDILPATLPDGAKLSFYLQAGDVSTGYDDDSIRPVRMEFVTTEAFPLLPEPVPDPGGPQTGAGTYLTEWSVTYKNGTDPGHVQWVRPTDTDWNFSNQMWLIAPGNGIGRPVAPQAAIDAGVTGVYTSTMKRWRVEVSMGSERVETYTVYAQSIVTGDWYPVTRHDPPVYIKNYGLPNAGENTDGGRITDNFWGAIQTPGGTTGSPMIPQIVVSTHGSGWIYGSPRYDDFSTGGKFLRCMGTNRDTVSNDDDANYPQATFYFEQDYYVDSSGVPQEPDPEYSKSVYEPVPGQITANPGSLAMTFFADSYGIPAPDDSYRAPVGSLLSYSTDCIKGWLQIFGNEDSTDTSYGEGTSFSTESVNYWPGPSGSSTTIPPRYYESAFDARTLGASFSDVLVRLAYEARANLTRGQYGESWIGWASGGKVKYPGYLDDYSDYNWIIPSWYSGSQEPTPIFARDYIYFSIQERPKSETFNSVHLSYGYNSSLEGTGVDPFTESVVDDWLNSDNQTAALPVNTYVSRSRDQIGIRTFYDFSYTIHDSRAALDFANYMARELCRPRRIATITLSGRVSLQLTVADIVSVEIPASGYSEDSDSPNASGTFYARVTRWERTAAGVTLEATEIPGQVEGGEGSWAGQGTPPPDPTPEPPDPAPPGPPIVPLAEGTQNVTFGSSMPVFESQTFAVGDIAYDMLRIIDLVGNYDSPISAEITFASEQDRDNWSGVQSQLSAWQLQGRDMLGGGWYNVDDTPTSRYGIKTSDGYTAGAFQSGSSTQMYWDPTSPEPPTNTTGYGSQVVIFDTDAYTDSQIFAAGDEAFDIAGIYRLSSDRATYADIIFVDAAARDSFNKGIGMEYFSLGGQDLFDANWANQDYGTTICGIRTTDHWVIVRFTPGATRVLVFGTGTPPTPPAVLFGSQGFELDPGSNPHFSDYIGPGEPAYDNAGIIFIAKQDLDYVSLYFVDEDARQNFSLGLYNGMDYFDVDGFDLSSATWVEFNTPGSNNPTLRTFDTSVLNEFLPGTNQVLTFGSIG